MYAKANGEVEVHWDQILEKAGLAGVVDPPTAARNLKEAGYKVQARKPREKPCQVDRARYRHGRLGIPMVGYGHALKKYIQIFALTQVPTALFLGLRTQHPYPPRTGPALPTHSEVGKHLPPSGRAQREVGEWAPEPRGVHTVFPLRTVSFSW